MDFLFPSKETIKVFFFTKKITRASFITSSSDNQAVRPACISPLEAYRLQPELQLCSARSPALLTPSPPPHLTQEIKQMLDFSARTLDIRVASEGVAGHLAPWKHAPADLKGPGSMICRDTQYKYLASPLMAPSGAGSLILLVAYCFSISVRV